MSWPTGLSRLVVVEWIDASSFDGWRPQATMLTAVQGGLGCRSVGWILYESEDRLVLVPNLSEVGSVGDAMVIPKVAILEVIDLQEAVDQDAVPHRTPGKPITRSDG